MRPRTILLLVVAIGCGLVAAFMVNQISGGSKGKDMVDVIVPKTDIPQGKKIDVTNMFVTKQFPKESVPLNVVNDPKELQGKILSRTVSAGQFVTKRELGNENMTILRELEPGYRAMTVRATVESGLHGFLIPGSRVDVMTIVRDREQTNVTESKIFLQNIKVLAVNTLSDQPEKGVVGQPTSITLMLRPQQVERMYLVSSRGQIGVVLRKPGDIERAETKGATSPFADEDDQDGTPGKPGSGPQTVPVAVAIHDIPQGTQIKNFDEHFKIVQFQKSQVFGRLISDRAEIEGKQLGHFLAEGQPASQSNFLVPGEKLPATTGSVHRMTIINGLKSEVFEFGGSGGTGPRGKLPAGKKLDSAAPAPEETIPPKSGGTGGSEAKD